MGYAPNMAAKSLATSRTRTVAFVTARKELATSSDPFYPEIMQAAELELARHGYHVILATIDGSQVTDIAGLPVVRENRVDGLILAGPDIASRFIISAKASSLPVVLVDNALQQTEITCVLSDNEGGGYEATRHLLKHGHRQVACLSGPMEWASSRGRVKGYERAMREANIEPLVIQEAQTTMSTGYKAMAAALTKAPHLSAIFAINDAMAIGAIRAAQEAGRRMPSDLAVVGFDDIVWAQVCDLPLTTMKVFRDQMGVLAAQRMLDVIAGREECPVKALVGTKLIIRRSCGCTHPATESES